MITLIKRLINELYSVLTAVFCVGCGDTKYKKYVIEHSSEIRKYKGGNGDTYIIDTCNMKYWKDITIRRNSDSSYTVVFWRDRDLWLWMFRSEKSITMDFVMCSCYL